MSDINAAHKMHKMYTTYENYVVNNIYRLALIKAKNSDLSGAIEFALAALEINPEHKCAKKLLKICLYERNDFKYKSIKIGHLRAFDRLVLKRTIKTLPHKSVRALNILGCIYAVEGRRKKAAKCFAMALDKDKGNTFARRALVEVTI